MKPIKRRTDSAFTIIELLVVIVVIGVIAAISFVAYMGVSQRAVSASLKSDLSTAAKRIKMFQIENSAYPNSLTDCPNPAPSNLCVKLSSGNSYIGYAADNTSSPQTYLLIAGNGSIYYKITDSNQLAQLNPPTQPGVTPGATVELHAAKANSGAGPGINSPITTTWADTSGNNYNGIALGLTGSPWIGTGTAVNPYALAFTGGDDYVYTTNTPINKSNFTLEVWDRQTIRSPAYTRWLTSFSSGGLSDWNGDGTMYALLWGTGGPGYSLVATPGDLANGALHHIVMTVSTTELKLYVDNGLVGTSSLVGFVTNDPGASIGLATNGWIGNISVARLYGWPLSATQVSANYAAGADW
ncbi:MAG: LamG domain-containing protein [Candidatus Saccharibacteria bacterium]|nr:LamG domain-containing protein [Candidatus Saccharibacteria bacterium]